jgi:hypothetical protein
MLWKYSLQFSGLLDAPSDLVAARDLLIAKIHADPSAFISKIESAEPSVKNLTDLGRAVFGLK